jgi:phosphomannomutase
MSPATEFSNRQHPDTIVLFDVDGTLTPARNVSLKTRLFCF